MDKIFKSIHDWCYENIHFWKYRNPFDRRCGWCNRHENEIAIVYRRDDDSGDYIAGSYWEQMY